MNTYDNTEVLLTIICCYNNYEAFRDLSKMLESQSEKYELIGIDNCNKKYSSISAAYNFAMTLCETKYVLFIHQDISFETSNVLREYIGYLNNVKLFDMVGAAGVLFSQPGVFTNIFHGENHIQAGRFRVQKIIQVDTLDECFFGGLSQSFLLSKFDEKLCNNWHLYAVDRCLANKLLGGKIYVCDCNIYHYSKGNMNFQFYWNFLRLLWHYRKKYNFIRTTCVNSKVVYSRIIRLFIKRIVRKIKNV